MIIKVIFFLNFCMFTLFAQAQPEQLTNAIPIGDTGIRLILCDNVFKNDGSRELMNEREISYNQPLFWMLDNPSSNSSSLIFLGMTNSFNFKLFTTNGNEVSKTARGEAMNTGPKSLNQVNANPYVRREGVGIRDFPKLTELFNFTADETYIFELRYWHWTSSANKFVLSNPVRLRVLKKDKKLKPDTPPFSSFESFSDRALSAARLSSLSSDD